MKSLASNHKIKRILSTLSDFFNHLKTGELSTMQIIGLSLWPISILAVCASCLTLLTGEHTVVNSYLLGGERWENRLPLYSGPGGFIYSPFFAFLFSPLTYLPTYVVDLLWRAISISFYFFSIILFLKHLSENSEKKLLEWLGIFSLIAIPIAFSGFRNGQMNVILTASMVMISHLLVRQRWHASALLLALILCLKPTFIVFFLLATSLFRPLWSWILFYLTLFLTLPFYFTGLDYSYQQYCNYIEMMKSAVDLGVNTPKWASFFNIPMQVLQVQIDHHTQVVVKLLLAFATWLSCRYAVRNFDPLTAVVYLFSFAGTYHLLFNPRSVNTDYIILGTIMATWFTAALYLWNDKILTIMIGILSVGVLFALDLSRLFIPASTSWVNPLMALFFVAILIVNQKNKRTFQTIN
ncbi:MAG: glycosyltransferase family 87 protein [Candidatus Endonucleobacter bathymodioli]|uniref:Glycosyltransferase family 87 protein n=1 Tax=Candidatus Endonucleibacter bathymodioli TaxID=539814 RepID=A0AA90NUN9_9GAMM|nr:glycosyltransferase family 87 protein [Candidatus Endonucleobacter bathymodioli]